MLFIAFGLVEIIKRILQRKMTKTWAPGGGKMRGEEEEEGPSKRAGGNDGKRLVLLQKSLIF